jgi:hypothetical protein
LVHASDLEVFAVAARRVHPLVEKLARGLKPPAPSKEIRAGTPDALAHASNLEAIMFAGFFGGVVEDPSGGREWQVLYLDFELNNWLLVEPGGIIADAQVADPGVPFEKVRDVIWVKADTAVGRGSASQSVEAQFLTGEFTRAGDFEVPPAGGTSAAATGIFCQARTVGCCYGRSRR